MKDRIHRTLRGVARFVADIYRVVFINVSKIRVTHKVFVSSTTSDLGTYRQAVANVLTGRGYLPVFQPTFRPHDGDVLSKLRREIKKCQAVICLVGPVYGSEPRSTPEEGPHRSYTQREFDIAQELGMRVYLFIADETCKFDFERKKNKIEPDPKNFQRIYIEKDLKKIDKFSYPFKTKTQLEKLTLEIPLFPWKLWGEAALLIPSVLVCLPGFFYQLHVTRTWPSEPDIGMGVAQPIEAEFDERAGYVHFELREGTDANSPMVATRTGAGAGVGFRATWQPLAPLKANQTYTASIKWAIGHDGGRLRAPASWQVLTAKEADRTFLARLDDALKRKESDWEFAKGVRVRWAGKVSKAEGHFVEFSVDSLPGRPEAVFQFEDKDDVLAVKGGANVQIEATIKDYYRDKNIFLLGQSVVTPDPSRPPG